MFMNSVKRIIPAFLTLLLLLGVYSCNTDDEPQAGLTGDSSSALSAEITGDDYFSMVEELSISAMQSNESDARIAISGEQDPLSCANISFNGTLNGGELIVDFGSEGCEGPDGKIRKGKIIISVSGSVHLAGSSASISLAGFSVDGVTVDGNWTITIDAFALGSMTFETKLTNGKVTWPNGASATREASRTYLITYELEHLDDVTVSVEGTASGTTTTGLKYASVVSDPLVFKTACAVSQSARIPVQGTIEITSDKTGFAKVIVNFGNGDCDETFIVTVGPITKEMTPGDLDSFI